MGVLVIMSLFLTPIALPGGFNEPVENAPQVGVVAHRGAGGGDQHPERPPENTLPALEWGWEHGATWVECDVILSGDGVPMLTHDFDSAHRADKAIAIDRASLEDIRTLDAGSWKSPHWAGLRMPTLSEALTRVPADKGLVIEIKSGPEAAVPVMQAIEASLVDRERVMIISFNVDTIRACRVHCQTTPILWLMSFEDKPGDGSQSEWSVFWRAGPGRGARVGQPFDLEQVMTLARSLDVDGLDTSVNHPAFLSKRLASVGLIHGVWTVNDPARAVDLVRSGVREVTTDEPEEVIEAFREAGFEIVCRDRRRARSSSSPD